jgi:hypothetical protein
MGLYFMDQYSLLHFAVGIISFFWNISLLHFFILHTLFEILENTQMGMNIINKYITIWPGGKPAADSFVNILGDTFFAILGWVLAKFINDKANENKFYF